MSLMFESSPKVDDDVGLNVLRCRVGILGTNCNKLLKLKLNVVGGGGGGGGGIT